MLVLTRQKDQRIVIEVGGAQLELTIVEVWPDKVRLGFAGPDSFKIFRSELFEAILKENQSAAALEPSELSMRVVPGPSPRAQGRQTRDPERN